MAELHPSSTGTHPPAEVATRERLLDTAEALFAERGFGNASVRELTSCADCNIAAVNYHFGGKAGLYEAVFRRRLQMLRKRRVGAIQQLMVGPGEVTLEALLRTFITAFVEPIVERSGGRTIMQLMVRELLDPHLPRELLLEEMLHPVQSAMTTALCRVMPGLSPEDATRSLHSLVGQIVHTVHTRNLFEHDTATFEVLGLQEMVDHIVRFSTAGIQALVTPLENE